MSCLLKIKNKSLTFNLLLTLFTVELFSVLAWQWPILAIIFLVCIAVILFYALWHYPKLALFVPAIELFSGAMGRALSYGFVSLRMLIFAVVILYFIIYLISKKQKFKIINNKKLWLFYLIWLGILFLALVNGFLHGQESLKIFLDFNNYLYWLYLPIWYQFYDDQDWSYLWQSLRLIAIYLSIKTLVIFSIFSQFDYQYLVNFYKWLRDTRFSEITPLGSNFYRIFSQSQIFILIAFLALWLKQIYNFKNYKNLFLIIIFSSALLLSLSRSFWLGGAVAFLVMMLLANFKLVSFSWKILLKQVFMVFVFSSALVMLLYNVPKFNGDNIFKFSHTESREQSLSSRQALLAPLKEAIISQAIIGYGFGKEITYYSNDPRIKNEANPSGKYSTYALEWGWLDFMLKFGLIATIFILVCLILVLKQAYVIIKQAKLSIFLVASLVALMFIHFFSPYLNHPLGIGWLMILIIYVYNVKFVDANKI